MASDRIQVAVRVRPFSDREKGRNARLIVHMEGQTTSLINPDHVKDAPKKFTFDHSYWSHDGFKSDKSGYCEPKVPRYADQMRLFEDLGRPMLESAWGGYNCSIFAYGQTGSGKSYSIMGHGANKGLVPRVCEKLFSDLGERNKPGVSYEVHFSMLEIYNEQVRDLLQKKKNPSGGLKVKERPGKGFFVEGLSVVPVGSFNDIRLRMTEGDRQRTIAATKMNETSSRAHTIVEIRLAQNSLREKVTKLSSINLVDLAGSERAKQTEATGDRFEEAKNINKSLLTLGNVIKALCDQAKDAKKRSGASRHIPYRDSVLTRLLQNALGGNSKTVMIAAISPDAENYEQSLSTLRYADRAKSIQTSAVVNQTATDKLIQELISEKERLLNELQNARTGGPKGFSEEEIRRMKEEQEAEISRYKEQLQDTEAAWQRRLEEARKEMEEMMEREKQKEEEEKKLPHFANLNEDPALAGKLIHIIRKDNVRVGNGKNDSHPEIILNGPRIAKEHAEVLRDGGLHLRPLQGLVLHNGQELTANKKVKLAHNDRIRFGSNNLFVFINPKEAEELRRKGKSQIEVTYDYAQSEIAKHAGLNIEQEDVLLQEEVMSIMQLVGDVNAMAEDMEKQMAFSIVLVSAEARGLEAGRTEVYVRLHDQSNDNEYLWDRNKFLVRQSHMQEMFQTFEETGEYPQLSKEKDPFWEPADTPVLIGVASVPLNYLSHLLEFAEEPLTVIDYRARQIGFVKIDIMPCDSKGREDVDLCVDDPMDMVGSKVNFKIKVHQALNLPDRYEKSWCKYRFYNESDYSMTEHVAGNNPRYNHEKMYRLDKNQVDHKFVDYLREKSLPVEIWGQQFDNTGGSTTNLGRHRREEKQKLQEELDQAKRQADSLQKKLDKIAAVVGKHPKQAELVKIKKILDS